MPQVPYQPIPSVSPITPGTPKLNIVTPGAAFGENVGQALSHLGTMEARVGDEMFSRGLAIQELANQTEAKEADAQFMIKAGDLHAQFKALQGKDAVAAYPKFQRELQLTRDMIRKGMSNESAMRLYDTPSLNTMGRTIFNGAEHSAVQMKRWHVGSIDDKNSAIEMEALNNPDSDDVFRQHARDIAANVREKGMALGWDFEQIRHTTMAKISHLAAKRIEGKARTAPSEAMEMLEGAIRRGEIRGEDIVRADRIVRGEAYNTSARNLETKINADLFANEVPGRPEKTLADRLKEAAEEAEKLMPGDARFKDAVRDRVRAGYNAHKSAVTDDERRNIEFLTGGLNGSYGGVKPWTLENLFELDPKMEATYKSLPETKQRMVLNALDANARRGERVDASASRIRLNQLIGLSMRDRAKFLDEIDPWTEPLNEADRNRVLAIRSRLTQKAEADPRVAATLRLPLVANAMRSLGIRPDSVLHDQFAGSIQDGIAEFQLEEKRAPKAEEREVIAMRLLQETATGRPGLIGSIFSPVITSPDDFLATKEMETFYRLPIPPKRAEEIRADPSWLDPALGGKPPTDEQVRRTYIRLLYRERYGKKTTTP